MSVVCEVGVCEPSSKTSGWRRVLEQEKTPHRTISDISCPVIVCEGQVPDRLAEFLQEGGVAIVTSATEGRQLSSCFSSPSWTYEMSGSPESAQFSQEMVLENLPFMKIGWRKAEFGLDISRLSFRSE